ncbi:MAG: DUF4390 domain-containing protein [Thermodesulfovibrio sp.]|nr:DUF4390 domain-containing protein [Thermodesulfovibrio sp.]
MKTKLKILIVVTFFLLTLSNSYCIEDIEMSIQKDRNSLWVKADIIPSEEFIEDFKNGLSKNLFISVALFRRWSIIPDEFITGIQIKRKLISDPIKEEFIIESIEPLYLKEKRFKDCYEALKQALRIDNIKISELSSIEAGKYYIKIVVESNIKKLPAVLEHILFFIPKYDKKIEKKSEVFRLP